MWVSTSSAFVVVAPFLVGFGILFLVAAIGGFFLTLGSMILAVFSAVYAAEVNEWIVDSWPDFAASIEAIFADIIAWFDELFARDVKDNPNLA